MLLGLLLIKIALYGVENAVDKLRSFVGGKSPGDFESFVDCDLIYLVESSALRDRRGRRLPRAPR